MTDSETARVRLKENLTAHDWRNFQILFERLAAMPGRDRDYRSTSIKVARHFAWECAAESAEPQPPVEGVIERAFDAHLAQQIQAKERLESAPPIQDERLRTALEEALREVEYQPGDHSIVLVKHAAFVKRVRELIAATPVAVSDKPEGRRTGWKYLNEDTGVEWALNHPIESGEVPDATEIEAMTLGEFEQRYPADKPEGEAHAEFQEGWVRFNDALNAVRAVIFASARLDPQVRPIVQSHLGVAIRNLYDLPRSSLPTDKTGDGK